MVPSELLELAARQHGVVSVRQAAAVSGVDGAAIRRRLRAGVLVEVAPRVVRIASSPETFNMRCMAIQLSFDGCGFLGDLTAARLAGLRSMPADPIQYTTPPTVRRSSPTWAEARRSEWFDADRDRTTRPDGLIVATPLRMLFGLAARLNQFRFERAAEDAWHLGLLTPTAAAGYLDAHRCRGKDGVGTFERWLERVVSRDRPAQSGLELALIDALDRQPIPQPVRQHPLRLTDGELIHLDLAWPDVRLAVEPGDSWWHGGDHGQRRDQARDRGCGELGWMVVRFDQTMRDDLDASAAQVARIHAQRHRDLQTPERDRH